MLNRVSTASLYQQNLNDISGVQVELAKLNKQISSGQKADSWDQLNGVVERVSGYQTKIDNINTYKANNATVSARLGIMSNSVSQLQDVAQSFASLVAQRRGGTSGSDMNFTAQANSMLDQIAQSLNSQISGRYLFSGSNTDTAPVTQPVPDSTTPGIADANYYNGNSDVLSARVDDAQVMNYGVTANNPAFQDLIGAIKTALAGNAGNNDTLLGKAVDMVNSAIKGLAAVKTTVDTNVTNLKSIEDQHGSLTLYWQQSLSDETSTDVAEASIKLAADQTTLQATFQSFASLTKLKLTDYL